MEVQVIMHTAPLGDFCKYGLNDPCHALMSKRDVCKVNEKSGGYWSTFTGQNC